ncbi:MAG TPA: hypothetical protein VGB37_07320, partial [Candidatus Lokiarchaeia archaeon]
DLLSGANNELINNLGYRFSRIISHDTLLRNDPETLSICREWEALSSDIFHAYQDQAFLELEFKGKPIKFSSLLRKFKRQEKELLKEKNGVSISESEPEQKILSD